MVPAGGHSGHEGRKKRLKPAYAAIHAFFGPAFRFRL